MIYKCKICGGSIVLDRETGVAECEYCGTKQVLPLFTKDSERLLYESGNNYLSHSEFDKAENVFNQLLTISPNAAELYWDLVLCKYGVTYVKDPKTQKYIPTCNRTHFESVLSDKNYKKAISLATDEKKAFFEEVAQTIDNIQKGILAVYKKEKPFDIFISYKETDVNGNRTKDSIEAQKLYESLTEAGYKVFFSRITLEDKIGTEYEPYIYSALHSSKIMLTVCSSKDNIESPWVKNEWSRFLGFKVKDSSKSLLPLYFDMEKSELPEEFALLSSYNLEDDGFAEELLRGIKKLIPLPIMKAKRRKKIKKTVGIVLASLVVVLGIVAAILIPKVLEEKQHQSDYQSAMALFENADYSAAEEAFSALNNYRDSVQMVKKCQTQPIYDNALRDYYDGKYAYATWEFEALDDYEDAFEMKEKAELSWRKSLANVICKDPNWNNDAMYYITENGTVDLLSGSGNAHVGIDITKHGRVVSIATGAPGGKLYALHEDGYVSNAKENNNLDDDSEWHNIIQITEYIDGSNIALRADGKVLVSKEGLTDNKYSFNGFPDETERYTEIFGKTFTPELSSYFVFYGITEDANVRHNISSEFFEGDASQSMTSLEGFNNAKKMLCGLFDYFSIGVISQDGSLLIEGDNIIDDYITRNNLKLIDGFSIGYNYVLLLNNGDCVDFTADKTLLYDVVSLQTDSKYAITKSGSIYKFESTWNSYGNTTITCASTNKKTIVYSEWLKEID